MVGGYYFWLGASADAETGSHRSDQARLRGLVPPGFDPARKCECGCSGSEWLRFDCINDSCPLRSAYEASK